MILLILTNPDKIFVDLHKDAQQIETRTIVMPMISNGMIEDQTISREKKNKQLKPWEQRRKNKKL